MNELSLRQAWGTLTQGLAHYNPTDRDAIKTPCASKELGGGVSVEDCAYISPAHLYMWFFRKIFFL
jgi:hypothetical protein